MPDNDVADLARRKELFDREVSDALARQIDRQHPLPTDENIRRIVRDELDKLVEKFPNYEEVRRVATEEAKDVVGSIGLDVSDRKAQAATAAEIARWRETQATIKSVAMKILLSAAGAIGVAATTLAFWKTR